MISVEPQTSITLVNVPWENDYKHQRTFADATAQATYFNGLTKQAFTNFTYQRKDGYITVGANIETIRTFNYVYYTNTGFSNKIFYAFITNMEYVGENQTRIDIETDVWQTWQFQLTYNRCFVEREHVPVSNDTVGANTFPENVETGEPICNAVTEIGLTDTLNNKWICVATTYTPPDMGLTGNGRVYNGIYSGTFYVLFKNATDVGEFIYVMDLLAKADAITCIFIIPKTLVDEPNLQFDPYYYTDTGSGITYTWSCAIALESDESKIIKTDTITMNATLNGYTPKNAKLKCYPYNYMYLTNNAGESLVFRYEDFVNNAPEFRTEGSLAPSGSFVTYPLNYKKIADSTSLIKTSYSYEYGMSHGKYPICSWSSDTYINWLTQNGHNIEFNAISGAGLVLGGTALALSGVGTIAGVGMIGGGVAQITQTIISGEQHALVPPKSMGSNTGDVNFSSNNSVVRLKQMSIRSEYAQIIDNYFEMFGYKVNKLEQININTRTYWNYIKTIDCNIEGNIPNDDLLLIRKMFDNGVTLWHTNDMYDYSKNNH